MANRMDAKSMSDRKRPSRIVIVGAGVAGSLMARRLASVPEIALTVLEKTESGDHGAAGTGLNLGPNALKALTAFDRPLADSLVRASLPWRTLRKSSVEGRVLAHLDLGHVADCDGCRIRWSDLYRVFRADCDAIIRYGCFDVEAAGDPADPARTILSWRDSTGAHRLDEIDLLIGADGRYSRIRHAFSGPPAVRHLGVAIYRLLVRDTSRGLIDDHEQWFNGPNRLLAFRVRPDHVYIAGTFPIPPGDDIAEEAKAPAFLRAAYTPASGAAASAPVSWLVDTICHHAGEIHWARMQDHALLYAEPKRGILYVGDAAHGMVPTLGQGATQAIEDGCHAAAAIAGAIGAGRHDPRGWIESIVAARSARVRFVTELSRSASAAMLAGGDPAASFAHESEPQSLARLERLFRDIPSMSDTGPAQAVPS